MNMDQPIGTDDIEDIGPASPTALRDARWLAAALWGGLLLALLFTSAKGIESFTQGSITARYFNIELQGRSAPDENSLAVTGLVLSGLTALALLAGWYQFVRATQALLVAYGYSGREGEEPSPAEWLTTDDGDGNRTMLSDVLQYVGVAWAVMIVTPAILGAARVFS